MIFFQTMKNGQITNIYYFLRMFYGDSSKIFLIKVHILIRRFFRNVLVWRLSLLYTFTISINWKNFTMFLLIAYLVLCRNLFEFETHLQYMMLKNEKKNSLTNLLW